MSQATIAQARRPHDASPDVLAFASEREVDQYIEPILQMTRRVFPSAQRLSVVVEGDPEFPDDNHIVIEAEVGGLSVSHAVASRQIWSQDLFRLCPATIACIFRLRLEIDE